MCGVEQILRALVEENGWKAESTGTNQQSFNNARRHQVQWSDIKNIRPTLLACSRSGSILTFMYPRRCREMKVDFIILNVASWMIEGAKKRKLTLSFWLSLSCVVEATETRKLTLSFWDSLHRGSRGKKMDFIILSSLHVTWGVRRKRMDDISLSIFSVIPYWALKPVRVGEMLSAAFTAQVVTGQLNMVCRSRLKSPFHSIS